MRNAPITIASVTAVTSHTSAQRRSHKETVALRLASMRCHNCGMNCAVGSGSGHASRYSANSALSLSSIRSILYSSLVHRGGLRLKRLEHPLARPEQANLQRVLIHLIHFFEFLQGQPFHFLEHQ